jgi:anti-anti-sigma factor
MTKGCERSGMAHEDVSRQRGAARLRVSLRVEAPRLIVRLGGELDITNAGVLLGLSGVDRPDLSTVILELQDLTFCDADGLSALWDFREAQIAQGRSLWFARINARVRPVMELSGFAYRPGR